MDVEEDLDLLTVHGRTVKEMYRSAVHYDFISRTVEAMDCPVLANGNVYSAAKAESVLRETGAHGLMIGRGVIRNPWLFAQIRRHLRGEPPAWPSGRDVLDYVTDLFEMTAPEKYMPSSMDPANSGSEGPASPSSVFLSDLLIWLFR